MKNTFYLLLLTVLFSACTGDDTAPAQNDAANGNKVLLLKVDLLTNAFQGGKELEFEAADTFTIASVYHSPGDSGDIALNYSETGQPVFSGTIFWMGLGYITYPILNEASSFATVTDNVPMPAVTGFETVSYDEFTYYPDDIDYTAIWGAIDNLQAVKNYREVNPDAKVRLFLYTPSVGIGNPAEWSWIVMIKN